jgi:hypothetical protein
VDVNATCYDSQNACAHSENALQKQLSGELNQPSELYAPLRFAVNTKESQNVIHRLFQL